jgi:hypothetical protein
MRKLLLAVALFALVVGTAYGQYGSQPAATTQHQVGKKSTANPPLKTIPGTISDDGKTFTSDSDKSTWTLKNPENVKGHEGHHVNLQAHVYSDSKELHVMKVTMMGGKSGKKKGGS